MKTKEIIKGFSVGDKVQLYPSDTYKKFAEILDCNDLGWSFKMLPGTDNRTSSRYEVGDIVFISHQSNLTMIKK